MNILLSLAGLAVAVLVALILLDRLFPETAARLGIRLERRLSGLYEYSVAIPGFHIPYLQGGEGAERETVVLIHGFGGDKDNFTRAARFLTPHYRVICPDLSGFGEASRDLSANYYMADQVERVRAFLDQLGIQKAHFGGNSMGGFIAAQFSATYPERVASLWLLDAAGTHASHDTPVFRRYLETGESPLLVRKEADIAALIKAAMHRPPFMPHSLRRTVARRAVADYALHSRILPQLIASPLMETQYRSLATPCLIVWGEKDALLSPAGAASFKALFTNSRVDMMPGIGHMPMLETPKLSAQRYLEFLRALPDT
ncbi:MAG: alpha/beta fold hydrolase [Burkholderiaceae bacterium]|nr:alpha/beta fold hydrolase [Burkholderiaceae bacterium]